MSSTPASLPGKPRLSSSLKERLKRCGRYHASPEPVARQPKNSVATSVQEKTQSDYVISDVPVSPCAKRLCMDENHDKEFNSCMKLLTATGAQALTSPVLTGIQHQKLPSVHSENSDGDKEVNKNHTDTSCLNQTPLSQRSRSCLSKVKGSKLEFKDTVKGNVQESNKEEAPSISSNNMGDEQICNLSEPNTDLSRSRSELLKELKYKEEQLRKLRMVRMYRSKNNLAELQTLINKWRDVSQQALRDLHAAMPEPRPTLTDLINHLGIDHQLVHFSPEEDETFF